MKFFLAFILLGAAAIVPVAALPVPDDSDPQVYVPPQFQAPKPPVSRCLMIIFDFVTDISNTDLARSTRFSFWASENASQNCRRE